jgi:hypothetical protein
VGLTKVGNQKALKHTEKFVFVTNLEQMFSVSKDELRTSKVCVAK